ncbi:MAG: hypothetical protein VW268_01790 [Rhodospirillaceae bacterium]
MASIAHHEVHLKSTETVSEESHVEALKAIEEKQAQLHAHLEDKVLEPDHEWHGIRDRAAGRIDRLRQEFARMSG